MRIDYKFKCNFPNCFCTQKQRNICAQNNPLDEASKILVRKTFLMGFIIGVTMMLIGGLILSFVL